MHFIHHPSSTRVSSVGISCCEQIWLWFRRERCALEEQSGKCARPKSATRERAGWSADRDKYHKSPSYYFGAFSARASCCGGGKWEAHQNGHSHLSPRTGVSPKYCRQRERELSCAGGNQFLQLRSIFNYSSAHQLYCTHWRAHRSKKSPTRCAHTVLLMSRICFHFFLLPRLQIVVDESGNPEYNFWLKSNCLLAFEWLGFILSH